MSSVAELQQGVQKHLSRLSRYLQPQYLIQALALVGTASIASEAAGSNVSSLIGAIGGSVGIEMLGHLLSKLDKSEMLEPALVDAFCKALDQCGIENWLSRTDLQGELDRTARIIGTALQHHENTVVNRLLAGVSYFDRLRSLAIKQVHEDVVNRFDPEKRYLARLIHQCESRDGVDEYVDLSGYLDAGLQASKKRAPEQRRIIDPALEGRPISVSQRRIVQRKADAQSIDSIRSLLATRKKFVLLGDPGSGKTITLRRMVLDLAWQRLRDPATPIPLYLELPQWKIGSILEFLIANWSLDSDLLALMVEGKICIFLDGLNEMGTAGLTKAAEIRKWLLGRNHPEYLVVTCRTNDYEESQRKEDEQSLSLGIETVRISPFDDNRVEQLSKKYLSPDEISEFLAYIAPLAISDEDDDLNFFQEIDDTRIFEREGVSKLVRNPFMLRALLLLYTDAASGALPKNVGSLFETLVTYLWKREHNRHTFGWIDNEDMKTQLSNLAFHMIETETGTSIPLSVAETFVAPDAISAMASANLVEVSSEELRFYHQSLQEYFAAVKLKDIFNSEGIVPSAIIQPPSHWHVDLRAFDEAFELGMDYFKAMYPYRSKWKQTLISLCGIVTDVDTLISQLSATNPFVVVDCALSGVDLSSTTSLNLVATLKEWISGAQYWGERFWFADELKRFGFEPHTLEEKVEYFVGLLDWENVLALGPEAVTFLEKLSREWNDHDYYSEGIFWCLQELGSVSSSLESAIAGNFFVAYELIDRHGGTVLQDLFFNLDHWDSEIREASAKLLSYLFETRGHLGYDTDKVEHRLIDCTKDKNWFVAKAAVHALSALGTPTALRSVELFWKQEQGKWLGHIGH